MNRAFFTILLTFFALAATAQTDVKVMRQQSLKRYGIPAGNYSGITHIGGNRYAVCDDKGPDGFHLWDIDIDLRTGKILDVRNVKFCKSGAPNRDAEDIAYVPDLQTIFMVSEADSRIYAYTLDGTPLPLMSDPLLPGKNHSTGLEGLTYDPQRHILWAIQENDGTHHSHLFSLNLPLSTLNSELSILNSSFSIPHDPPLSFLPSLKGFSPPITGEPKGVQRPWRVGGRSTHGHSALCAMADGRLLVLEREAYVPRKKIGAWCRCKLFSIYPEKPSEKRLLTEWRTRLNLTARSWANYEGMCLGPQLEDGRQVIVLLSDSQNRYGGVLQDRIRTILLPP